MHSRWYYGSQRRNTYRRPYNYYGRSSNYYFGHGRWLPFPLGHIHGPSCGHVFQYGRWVAYEPVPYPMFVPVPVTGQYYYDGGWYAEPPPYVEEAEVIIPPEPEVEEIAEPEPEVAPEGVPIARKSELQRVLVTRNYDLDWWQSNRVQDLISKGVIESLLAGGEGGQKSRIVFDKMKQRLTITAPPDDVMKVRTIIDDDLTYRLFTREEMGDLVADVVPLVDLRFFESDPNAALRTATDNYAAADDVLRSSEKAPLGREWWFNDRLGTVTVKDSAENLDQVYNFMESRPYLVQK